MLNGRQVASSIDDAWQQAQREATVIDRELAHLTDRLLQLTEERNACYRTLARVRFDTVRGGQLIRNLSLADQKARELVEQRENDLAALDREQAAAAAGLAGLNRERADAQARYEACARNAAAAEQAVRADLARDTDYQQQQEATQRAAETARFATQKTELAQRDRELKGKPYEDDRLFAYLWERRYGTPDYRGNFLVRLVDGWVARLCGYRNAAANYAMLLEIPKRLAQHAERLRAAVDREAGKLRDIEETALSQGESGRLRQDLRAAQERLDAIEDRLEAAETEANRLLNARNTLALGEDDAAREAIAAIDSTLRVADLRELREAALGTPIADDDAAVRRLESIEMERKNIEAALENQKALQLSQRRQLAELEEVRREYRRGGYRNDSWDFGSGEMLSVLLGEMLRGAMSRDIFWDSMRRHQRPGPPPDLGGGGGNWPTDGGGGGFNPPDDFGDGGFRTGGGF